MPFITNSKNDEFGHAQTQRDIEYLYMLLGTETTEQTELGMSQEIADDTVGGVPGAAGGAGPVGAAGVSTIAYLGQIGNGNKIVTINSVDYYGLLRPGAAVTTVPTVTPPVTDDGCPDGLTIGIVEDTAGVQHTVWIGIRVDPGTGVVEPLVITSIPNGVGVLIKNVVSMPCSAGGNVDVYVPFRIL